MVSNIALWSRIACFTPEDPDAAFQFTDRLARENAWSKAFAAGAVEEYKKFVYLAAVSPTPVTPSDVVDQVWHLHLTFTRSYWDELCGRVLERPLHHGPTKGGPVEDGRYRGQYARTLALYGDEFGAEAPDAYWPDERARFSGAQHQHWIDKRTHWVIRKPNVGAWAGVIGGGALMTLATAAVANGAAGTEKAESDIGAIIVGGAVAVAIVLFAMMMGRSQRGRRSRDGDDTSWIVGTTLGSGGGGKGKGNGGEGGEGGEGGGDGGGSGCGGGGGCGS